ncbi:MAG: hypothetical protein LLG40_05430 [Deltaproteobacteria bacterium]|nr:hypothetical protein [Deltaproteobacteria bacterium]
MVGVTDTYVITTSAAQTITVVVQHGSVKIVSVTVSAADATAPTTTAAPSVSGTTDTATTLSMTIDENGTGYYLVKLATDPAPTVAEVKAGTSFNMTANTAATVNITGLTAGTNYKIYTIAKDTAGNYQAATQNVAVSTNAAVDTTPDAFTFTDQTNVALSTVIESAAITVSGINSATAISVTGGEYSINGGAWTSAAGTVTNGQTVKVRHTSSAANATATNTVLTIGGVSDTFTSTTTAGDTTPDAFTFTDITDSGLSENLVSNTITVS